MPGVGRGPGGASRCAVCMSINYVSKLKENKMTEADRIKYLRIALLLVGLTFTFGIWPLGSVWPSGWVWHEGGRSEYL